MSQPPSANPESVLQAIGLRKSYTRGAGWGHTRIEALCGVSLEVRAGASLAIIGASGSGKSTLARCLAKLEAPDAGEVHLSCSLMPSAIQKGGRGGWGRVQLVFQDTMSLNPRFTASDIVSEPLLIARWRDSLPQRAARAAELLDLVGYPPSALHRRPRELSGGQRRRVAIARALAADPAVLIFDEAFAGLDLSTQGQLAALLLELQAARGLTYLWISHDLRQAARLARKVAVMDAGRIVEAAPPAELFATPRSAAAQALVRATRAWQARAQ